MVHVQNVLVELVHNVQNVLVETIYSWELQVVLQHVLMELMKLVLRTDAKLVMLVA